MDEDNDFPIINIPSEEEEIEEEEEQEEEVKENETKTEPEEFFKKPEMSLKEKRLENLRKAREARKKKKETKKAPEPEQKTTNIDYDLLVNTIVDKLEDNKAKRKAKKQLTQIKQNAEVETNKNINQVEIESNVYDKLFGF